VRCFAGHARNLVGVFCVYGCRSFERRFRHCPCS
jgi:hypothetical protein